VLKQLKSGRAAAVMALFVAALLLAACGGGGSSSSASSSESTSEASESTSEASESTGESSESGGVKIGFDSYADPSDGYTQAWQAGLECFAEENGDEVISVYSNVDLNKQITDVKTLLAQGVNGIFLYPLDTAALTPTFHEAAQQGVAVLSMNGPAPDAVNFDVNENRQALGGYTVKIAQEVVPSGGKAVIVGGPPQALAVQQQILGFTKAAEEAGIEILGRIDNAGSSATSQIQQGQVIGNELLSKYPEANIIYTLTPDQALGASVAAEGHGKKIGDNFAIVGSSINEAAAKAVEAGKISGLADDDNWMFGYNAAKEIASFANGGEVQVPQWHVTTYTKDNVAEWVPPENRCEQQSS
jgi:ABC-type sugar transport system substrate-binding protein